MHLSLFRQMSCCWSCSNKPWRFSSCSCWLGPKMIISSEMFLHPGRPVSISSTAFWKISDIVFIPNIRCLYRRRPTCVLNVVMWRLSGASSSWWYRDKTSNLVNTVTPFRSATRSSIIGIRCFSRLTALFASYMSTHILTWQELLGTMMMGLTHRVAPVTGSMMSSSSNCFKSISTSFLMWKGTQRCGCCLGLTARSMRSLITFPFTLLIPPKRLANSPLPRNWGLVSSVFTWLMILSMPNCLVVL